MSEDPEQISVIGGADMGPDSYEDARTVGRLLAEVDVTVVTGGGGGVMEAVAKGVQDVGSGRVIGIRPETDRQNANDYLDDVIVSGIGYARNLPVVLSGEAVIAVSGGYGTLSELAYAQKFDRRVFGVGTWGHERFDFESELLPEEAVRRALNLESDD